VDVRDARLPPRSSKIYSESLTIVALLAKLQLLLKRKRLHLVSALLPPNIGDHCKGVICKSKHITGRVS